MRKAIVLAAGVLVLLFVNYGIYQREQLLTDGRIVLLELSPVDPRSLMQGDYMRLNFAAADQAFPSSTALLDDGHLVVALDNRGVGRFPGGQSRRALLRGPQRSASAWPRCTSQPLERRPHTRHFKKIDPPSQETL